MKLKHLLIPYVLIIVILPGILAHIGAPFGVSMNVWQWIMDGIMAVTAIVGLIAVLVSRKKDFQGWLSLLVLLLFFILPQLYIWKVQAKTFIELRPIWRFVLLYITLFIIPTEIHFSRKEMCIIISLFVVYGMVCCGYELIQHPRLWEAWSSVTGKRIFAVESFFEQKNRFGAYLSLWSILCIFAFVLTEKKYWFIPPVFFIVFLIATGSRGGILLLAVFCFCCLISYHRRIGWKNLGMIFLDLAIVALIFWMLPPIRTFINNWIDVDRGVTGRDSIWRVSFDYFREANPFFGHGMGVQIERVLIERLGNDVSTHNMYLYILNSGGICLVVFYILSFVLLFRHHAYRHHYLIPLTIAVVVYGFFELACTPFDYWHLSNMFTICLFFFPAVSSVLHRKSRLPIH